MKNLTEQLRALIEAPATKVGDWTFPYKKPPGTKAVQVAKIVGDIVHLSDGSTMHKSYARPVAKGATVK